MYKNVIVTGGRKYSDYETIKEDLKGLLEPGDVVWHGGADGTDTLAGRAAMELGHTVVTVPAQWARWERTSGKNPAGVIRNRNMLKLANPRLVIAFPGGDGTTDMVKIAMKAEVDVITRFEWR